ncbi:MAG: helix-turn-helix transcriptional regulator [Proteobacteria bacterium]|nr:helix-turn-helix transcriptional regulator [Pseudomonadota bacterium]
MNHLTRIEGRAVAQARFLPFEQLAMPTQLTPRECEVLRCLATGKTDADIGDLLGISARTVQKHLEHIYVKLGVETRTAAVMRVLGPNL